MYFTQSQVRVINFPWKDSVIILEQNQVKQALNLEEMQKYLSGAVKSNSINTMMIC